MVKSTMGTYKNQIQGKTNKVMGAYFETQIDRSCNYYRGNGQAHIEKTPEPLKPIKSMGDGRYIAVFTACGQPDYKGVIQGGKEVCFEAKHTISDKIPQSAVKPHQANSLNVHEQLGAVCFILVSMDNNVYRVPWGVWKNMKIMFGHKHMGKMDLVSFRVPRVNGVYLFLENFNG